MKNSVSEIVAFCDSILYSIGEVIHDVPIIIVSFFIFGENIKEATLGPTTKQQFKREGYWFQEKKSIQVTKLKEGMN